MTVESPPPGDLSFTASGANEDTLAVLLQDHLVSWETLHQQYGPLLHLVRTLVGVVPNCDRYLEIWEPAFRTYNIMVPNFLNLPFLIFGKGSAPADIVGMGMYVSSRAAECAYCSAHSCSFALRRGASAEKMAQALVGGDAPFTPGELATIAVARSLARIPCELTTAERDELLRCFKPDHAEWIVLAIVMMGFLNKFMNTIGVELESPTVSEVANLMGPDWSPGKAGRDLDPNARRNPPPPADSFLTKLRIIPYLPTALRLDKQWLQGVPGNWPAAGEFLRASTGHDFPILARLRHARVIKSIAAMLRDNLDPATSSIGLDVKVLAGVIFAEVVADPVLGNDVRALAARNGVSEAQVAEARHFALTPDAAPPGSEPKTRAALLLARAGSPSPAEIDAAIVTACREGGLTATDIVELVCWLSVLQMLHRLICFFGRED